MTERYLRYRRLVGLYGDSMFMNSICKINILKHIEHKWNLTKILNTIRKKSVLKVSIKMKVSTKVKVSTFVEVSTKLEVSTDLKIYTKFTQSKAD